MFVVFEKNGAIFLVSLCPIAKSSTTKSRFARLDKKSSCICSSIYIQHLFDKHVKRNHYDNKKTTLFFALAFHSKSAPYMGQWQLMG